MGFSDYLKDLLRPLGLYNVDSGIGKAELDSEGAALDKVFAWMEELEREGIPATAEDWGLGKYEEILPYHPVSTSVTQRRNAVMALLRIDDASFTLQAIRDTVTGCGIAATVVEGSTPQTVEVSFPGVMGEPAGFAQICRRIEEIIPCHLDISYVLVYMTWQDLEDYGLTWEKIEDRELTWTELESYREEV